MAIKREGRHVIGNGWEAMVSTQPGYLLYSKDLEAVAARLASIEEVERQRDALLAAARAVLYEIDEPPQTVDGDESFDAAIEQLRAAAKPNTPAVEGSKPDGG